MTASPRSSVWVAAAGTLIHAVLWLGLAFGMLFQVPAYKREFSEYAMKLPYMTQVTIAVSDWFCNYWYIFAPVFIPLCVADAAILFLTWRSKRIRVLAVLWILVLAGLPLGLFALGAVSIRMPYARLTEALSREQHDD